MKPIPVLYIKKISIYLYLFLYLFNFARGYFKLSNYYLLTLIILKIVGRLHNYKVKGFLHARRLPLRRTIKLDICYCNNGHYAFAYKQ
jgi:hypothetical protein